MTEFRYMGELDLEWYAITEMFNENGNRVHVTLYESLKANNAYILFYISNLLAKAPGLNLNKKLSNLYILYIFSSLKRDLHCNVMQ